METTNVIGKKFVETGEESQTSVFRMAFGLKKCNGDVEQLHTTVKCKDFLGDYLFSAHEQYEMEVYSFYTSLDPHTRHAKIVSKEDIPNLCMIANTNDTPEQVSSLLNIFNRFERRFKFPTLTTITLSTCALETDRYGNSAGAYNYVYFLSPEWYKAPALLSFALGLIRMSYEENKVRSATSVYNLIHQIADGGYTTDRGKWYEFLKYDGKSILPFIIKNRDMFYKLNWMEYLSEEEDSDPGYVIHYGTGILSMLSGIYGKGYNSIAKPFVETYKQIVSSTKKEAA